MALDILLFVMIPSPHVGCTNPTLSLLPLTGRDNIDLNSEEPILSCLHKFLEGLIAFHMIFTHGIQKMNILLCEMDMMLMPLRIFLVHFHPGRTKSSTRDIKQEKNFGAMARHQLHSLEVTSLNPSKPLFANSNTCTFLLKKWLSHKLFLATLHVPYFGKCLSAHHFNNLVMHNIQHFDR